MQPLFTDKGDLTDVGTAFVFFGMISVLWVMTLICLIDRNAQRKYKHLHFFHFGFLIAYCLLALISQPLVIKIYGVLSVIAVTVVEVVIKKRRKKTDQPKTMI